MERFSIGKVTPGLLRLRGKTPAWAAAAANTPRQTSSEGNVDDGLISGISNYETTAADATRYGSIASTDYVFAYVGDTIDLYCFSFTGNTQSFVFTASVSGTLIDNPVIAAAAARTIAAKPKGMSPQDLAPGPNGFSRRR